MCGISGIIGKGWTQEELLSMVKAQDHRGPDANGFYISEDKTIGLGHNRLSIIDLSSTGNQPFIDKRNKLHIVFNGEIYNYLELKSELSYYSYQSASDTEVILAAYQKWGKDCVNHFNGMFAFAIWDEANGELFCARDRIGIKPFYFIKTKDKFCFSSEIKALIEAGYIPEMNELAVVNYLINGQYEFKGNTFFKNVQELPPGYVLVLKNSDVTIKPYWQLENHIAPETIYEDPPYWEEYLTDLINNAIKLRLRSDVPLGVHLSGGLDSSSLLCAMGDILPKGSHLEAFTGIFGNEKYDEKIFANAVTNKLNVHLNFSKLEFDRFWEIARQVQYYQEQPFGGIATMGYFDLEKLANEKGITVLLEGQGGDELFGGYNYYIADHVTDLLAMKKDREVEQLLDDYTKFHNFDKNSFSAKLKSMIEGKGKTYQDGSHYLRRDCVDRDFLSTFCVENHYERPSESSFTNARFRDIKYSKLTRVLRFNDRMSMSASRELRVPFLDHNVVEYSFKLSNDTLLKRGIPKYPLRKIMKNNLTDEIRMAPKRAVVTPQREYFRGPLKKEIINILQNSRLAARGILNKKSMIKAFHDFCEDDSQNNSFFIWQWVNLELWFQVYKL